MIYKPEDKGYERLCEAFFEDLAIQNEFESLSYYLNDTSISNGMKGIICDSAGESADSEAVRKLLLPMLDFETPIIVEGAIYGLCPVHLDEIVLSKLKDIAANFHSEGVRAIAQDVLDNESGFQTILRHK